MESKNYETKYKNVTKNNTISYNLTKADTWLFDYTNTYSFSENKTSDTQESKERSSNEFNYSSTEDLSEKSEKEKENNKLAKSFLDEQVSNVKNEIDKKKSEDTTGGKSTTTDTTGKTKTESKEEEVKGSITTLKNVYSSRILGTYKKTNTEVVTNKYTQGIPETALKTDADAEKKNFITLLNDYSSARKNLYELSEWLFKSMEDNEDTADMVDLTRYLFNVQSNSTKYGDVSEEDVLDWLKKSSFTSISANSAVIEWICCNENENLYNYLHYDGSYDALYVSTHITADKKNYIVRPDAGKSLSVNRNYGFGVLIYDNGSYNNIDNFSEYGIDIKDSKYNEEGAQISVEIVDSITKKIINGDKASIKAEAEANGVTLDDAQIAVLIDIKYQWGNIGNFFEVYKKAGQDRTNEAIRQFQAYDSSGNLGGKPLDGLEYVDRENRRWQLFSEGIYETANHRIIIPTAGTGGDIVEAAKNLVELTKYGGAEQTAYDASRKASSTSFSISEYVCASFVSEVLYNSNGFTAWHAGVEGLGKNLYSDPNYELIYYKETSNTVSDAGGVKELASNINTDKNVEDLIQPGDIVAEYSSAYKYQHVVVYIGDNQYAHHGGSDSIDSPNNYPHISSNFFSRYNNGNVKYIFRYKGN